MSYLVESNLGIKLFNEYNGQRYNSPYSGYSPYYRTAVGMTVGSPVPFPLFFLIFGSYVTLGFVAYFVLRKKNRSILLWGVQAGLALIASVLIMLCSIPTRITRLETSVVKYSTVTDDITSEEVAASVILPKNKSYVIDFSKDYTLQTITDSNNHYSYGNTQVRFPAGQNYNLAWLDRQGSNSLSLLGGSALSSRQFKFVRSVQSRPDIEFDAKYQNGKMSGYIKNNTDNALEICSVVMDFMVYPIGTIEAGETVDLATLQGKSTLDLRSLPHSYNWLDIYDCADLIFGQKKIKFTNMMGLNSKGFKKDYMRYNALDVLFNSNMFTDTRGINGGSMNLRDYDSFQQGMLKEENVKTALNLDSDLHPLTITSPIRFLCFPEGETKSVLANSKCSDEIAVELLIMSDDDLN